MAEKRRTTDKGMKRATTDKGMGAVRPSRMPPSQRGLGPPPIECPAPRVPQVEDAAARRARFSRRGTIDQSGSSAGSGTGIANEEDGWVEPPITTLTIPSVTAAARNLDGAPIAPRDAFLLSRIDGHLNAADLADLTGMPEREVLTTLHRLARVGLITLR